MTARGLTLVELAVALAVSGILLAAAGGMVAQHLRSLEGLTVRVETEEVSRTAFHVLGREVRVGRPGADWRLGDEAEVLSLRSFTGFARPCGWDAEAGEITVAHQGWGTLESQRDSVLVLPAEGDWRAVGVERLGAGSENDCPLSALEGGGEVERWRLEPFVSHPVALRPFRKTVYHLADGALRVEHGGAGRQPVTPERLADGSFEVRDERVLHAELRLDAGPFAPDRTQRWTVRPLATTTPGAVEP